MKPAQCPLAWIYRNVSLYNAGHKTMCGEFLGTKCRKNTPRSSEYVSGSMSQTPANPSSVNFIILVQQRGLRVAEQ